MTKTTRIIVSAALIAIAAGHVAALADDESRRRGGDEQEYRIKSERGGCEYRFRETRKGYTESLKCDGIWRDIARQKYEHEAGGCKYKYKADRHGYEEKYECKKGWSGYGAPPRRGPANVYEAPSNAALGVPLGRCDHELLGKILGGIAGAAVGSRVGKGDGRTAAVIGGTIIGVLIGGNIGRTMDQTDQHCVAQALTHAPDGQTVRWDDPDGRAQYAVTPTRTEASRAGRYCREYLTEVIIDGRAQQAYGTACRQPDGSWERAE